MHDLDCNELAILALLAIRPLSYFPPHPYDIARRLERRGLVAYSDGHWRPTPQGLDAAAQSLH